MHLIKTATPDGPVYSKPDKYKPDRHNRNAWYFADLVTNVSEKVWEIGQEYKQRIDQGKIRHKNKFPVQLLRYFYFLYLTGSRRMEPTMMPLNIALRNENGYIIVKIIKMNEKHGGRQMTQAIPVFNASEQAMWNYITDGGQETDPEQIFQFKNWKSTKKENLSGLIKTNFRTDLKDPITQRIRKDTGITPHILRHMRVYSVFINYHVPEAYAVMMFGWKDSKMLYYYAHIQETVSFRNQIEMLEKGDWLTSLQIDALKGIVN